VKKKVFPKKRINKNTVIAMFYNNKGANALVNNNYVAAYAYLKKATEVDPGFSSAWGNLGILYRMKGLDKIALSTYRHAIYLNQANLTAMENLSKLLHSRGASEEARLIDSHIIQKRANNPYYYALLGDENFHKGYYIKKAIAKNKVPQLDNQYLVKLNILKRVH
jgi:tetratricopeptide (TPR) repeat protein